MVPRVNNPGCTRKRNTSNRQQARQVSPVAASALVAQRGNPTSDQTFKRPTFHFDPLKTFEGGSSQIVPISSWLASMMNRSVSRAFGHALTLPCWSGFAVPASFPGHPRHISRIVRSSNKPGQSRVRAIAVVSENLSLIPLPPHVHSVGGDWAYDYFACSSLVSIQSNVIARESIDDVDVSRDAQ